ncbi:MAG: hypothetical protein A3K00_04405 [Gallionellales bacterium RIFOXYD2_FULL_52_7]|nr:MAG: hypothetical protein A3K00_04405 [Gallionellales bacterium RIFOXYD2_FULL_52_7]
MGMAVEVRDVCLDELYAADAVFLTNSVFGLWPVAQFEQQRWLDLSRTAQFQVLFEQDESWLN